MLQYSLRVNRLHAAQIACAHARAEQRGHLLGQRGLLLDVVVQEHVYGRLHGIGGRLRLYEIDQHLMARVHVDYVAVVDH